MTVSFSEIQAAAAALPIFERAQLAHFLLDSLEDEQNPLTDEQLLDLAESRLDELTSGRTKGIALEEVLRKPLSSDP